MFGFLQGFSYGLFLSCLPWFVIGMIDPRLAVPVNPPTRWRAILRYWVGVPFVAIALWLTSLWGGFSPSFIGWIAGLGALAVEIPLERRWRRFESARLTRRREAIIAADARRTRAADEAAAREQGVAVLDPAAPPVDADAVIHALCRGKQRLLDAERADLAAQADRLYSRYLKVRETLRAKFAEGEITRGRSQSMIGEVCLAAADNLIAMGSLAAGVLGIDAAYVRRRLADRRGGPGAAEREALRERLTLVDDTDRRLAELSAANEAAMTSLDNAAVVMARVQTDRPQARVAADRALHDLETFLQNADRYGRET